MYDVSIERDWIVQLVGRDRPLQLAHHNGIIRRLDQLSNLLGVTMIGYILSIYGDLRSAKVTMLIALTFLPIQLLAIRSVAQTNLAALDAATPAKPTQPAKTGPVNRRNPVQVAREAARWYLGAWLLFFQQRCLLATIAFVLLFFNVVLASGPILTTMLAQLGLSSASVSLFHVGAAMCGFLGSTVTTRVV